MRAIKAQLPVQQQIKLVMKRLCFSVFCWLTIIPANAEAQIAPDGTLPTVVEEQENMEKITGGEREGNNLFHSFEEFSVPEGVEAIFENGLDVENIFTRITGESASTINGILRTQGGANFFLVNPNGIVFGENAQLDVGGSFIATSANTIQFSDGTEFIASDAEAKPVLTVSVPIGLGFSGDSGAITVNGKGNQIVSASSTSQVKFKQRPTGISVPENQTFALIGNGVNLNEGVITTSGGQIYLNSLDSGSVSISPTESGLTLKSDNTTEYQDINLDQKSLIDASSTETGQISLTGKNINLANSSFIIYQNQGNSSGGSLNINATESLSLSGASSDLGNDIRSEALDRGKGANINISAKDLLLQDGARIRTNSFNDALGGDIDIKVSDSIQLSSSSIIATTFAEGNGGNINLSASELRLKNAGITSSTFGDGDGGLLNVNADLIEIAGSTATDRASIATTSFASGNVGNVTLNTTQLRVIDGASLSSSSFASGDAGNLTINASESIEVSGRTNNSITSSNPQSIIRSAIQSATPQGRKALGLPEVPSGNGGNLIINTPLLEVSQEGVISVENQGSGNAGTLNITADNLNLEEAGSITAATLSGTGGNITLNTQNLEIDTDSEITATAENNGDGGNVTINTTSLIAKKNNQVTANAFGGRGGNIDIEAQGVFLFDSPDNIFSASSKLGIDGTVNINTTTNFQNSFESISPEFIVAEEALQGSCFAHRNSRQGSFVYGGAGGLPVSPSSAIDEESSFSSQLPEVQPNSQTSRSSDLGGEDNSAAAETVIYSAQTAQKWQVGEPIIEPTNLIKTADGRLLWVRKQVDNASSLVCQ
ncbi:filamentous hemagglutinin [Pleurocapsa sp. CCALA 161]|uniref:two-partner secretion domain-containing protein n=1 Tax=Pleurocapsa sp. CCALA 161 TaxID=2107688 RepID=UPI000D084628|nr:filamentous hemagglutinin N-terminal domain-containing protein [Pleurocapsa sp. CCALA 161]PSB08439.1 filamentous hemagglutinin [Pleurocapsa sp. CCALA 161]